MPDNVQAQSRLIHYWNFNADVNNDTVASVGCLIPVATTGTPTITVLNNRIRPIGADYTTVTTATATVAYQLQPGVSNTYPQLATVVGNEYAACYTYLDTKAGSTLNNISGLGATAGVGIRARTPADSMQLVFYIPTPNYQNIVFSFASITSSAGSGPKYMCYSYSLDSGVTWRRTGLQRTSDAASTAYAVFSVAITDPGASNNPKLAFRITDSLQDLGGTLASIPQTATAGGNIVYDNVAVQGDTLIIPQTLMYFWDFNSISGTYVFGLLPAAPGTSPFPYINPDYTHPGLTAANAKVHMDYYPTLADSMSDFDAASTYFDDVAQVATDYDTVNSNWTAYPALAGVSTFSVNPVPAGNGIRPRNPLDSTYLYYFIPTTNYKNILLKYATQTSSLTSGDSIQTFNYSVDGGATWRLSGISEAYDSAWIAGMPTGTIPYRTNPITIQFTDPAANNCPGLVFRIGFKGRTGNTTGASGNNRFDNISLQGDSIIQALPTITTTPVAFGHIVAR